MLGKFIAGDFIAIVGEMRRHQMKTLLQRCYVHDRVLKKSKAKTTRVGKKTVNIDRAGGQYWSIGVKAR
jgi:hypothetical protein